jgi:hypothetical protein
LIALGIAKKIVLDFSEVPIISSSFADEVFGKLFVDLGALDRTIQQRNLTGL